MKASQEVLACRRRALMDAIGEGAVALVPAAHEQIRNRDTAHPFRQASDFHYLTGLDEQDALLALVPGRPEGEVVLWVHPRDPEYERWMGPRLGPEGVKKHHGADEAHPLDEKEAALSALFGPADRLYMSLGEDRALDDMVISALRRFRAQTRDGETGPTAIFDLAVPLHEQRLRKDEVELASLRHAVELTADGIRAAMAIAAPGKHEYELRAELEAVFTRGGAKRESFESIVAAGANGAVLHYPAGEAIIGEDELVLVDVGAELDYLAGDLTRTFPASGRFTEAQRALYEIVLAANERAIEQTTPGVLFQDLHDETVRILTQGMVDAGLLDGPADDRIADESYRRFFPHRLGHYLGVDCHDVGRYRDRDGWRKLEAGMVITIEPGLYVPADAEGVDERFRGIGIRIEDVVVVTENGKDVLSAGLAKKPAEIEAVVGGSI